MQIRFFATIRECTGESEIQWDQPAATVGELLRALSARYGPSFRRWVLEDGDLGKAILVVINGHDARHEGGIDAPLRPDDTVAIFPMIAGGHGQG
jgi:molybdopterin synthase sulfur carrier subunit